MSQYVQVIGSSLCRTLQFSIAAELINEVSGMFSSEPALASADRPILALKIKGIVFVTHKRKLDKEAGVKFYFNLNRLDLLPMFIQS